MPYRTQTAVPSTAAQVERFRALMDRGDVLGAEAIGLGLLKGDATNAELHAAIGMTLARAGLPRSAARHFRAAAERQPQSAAHAITLGRALLDCGEYAEATAVLTRAASLSGDVSQAHLLLGRIHAARQDRATVERSFAKALELTPPARRAAVAAEWLDMRISWGDFDSVRAELEAAMSGGAITAHQLANLVRLRTPTPDSAVARLVAERLERPDTPAADRITLLHAMAAIMERSGKAEEAFELLRQAKALKRSDYSAADFDAYVNRMVTVMTAPELRSLGQQVGDPSFRPIFVAGLPRSGTTLTEQILAAHDRVGAAGEASPMREVLLLLTHSGIGAGESLETAMRKVGLERIRLLRDRIRAMLVYRSREAPVAVDKTPQNFMVVHLILTLFPAARIVFCHRDPADNFMSAFRLDMTAEHGYSHAPETYARFYRNHLRLMRHWYREFPDRIFPLRYETLVTAPDATIRDLLRFLDLDWQEGCLNPHLNVARISTPSKVQVRSPINAGSVGGARAFAALLGEAFAPPADFAFMPGPGTAD